jgi:hypothetical protein
LKIKEATDRTINFYLSPRSLKLSIPSRKTSRIFLVDPVVDNTQRRALLMLHQVIILGGQSSPAGQRLPHQRTRREYPVGAAAGCDLLIVKKADQQIAASGSSYRVSFIQGGSMGDVFGVPVDVRNRWWLVWRFREQALLLRGQGQPLGETLIQSGSGVGKIG